MKMQKLGGYSAIALICLIVVLLAIVLPLSSRYGLNQPGAAIDPVKVAAVYSGSPIAVWVVTILEILLTILVLLVALALHERMQAKAPNLTGLLVIAASASCALTITNAMIGIRSLSSMVGAADVSIYKPFLVMQSGLSTASNNASGWMALLIGVAAMTTGALPRFIAYVFLVLGIFDVIGFALPAITGTSGTVVSIVLGLLYAVAMIWLGVVLLRVREAAPAKTLVAQAR